MQAGDPALEPGQAQIPIDRDPNFVRLMPDEFVVVNKGPWVDVGLIVAGPTADAMLVDIDEAGQVKQTVSTGMRPSYTEIAQLRLVSPKAVALAVQLLSEAIRKGQINIAALKAGIDAFADEANAEKAKDGSSSTITTDVAQ